MKDSIGDSFVLDGDVHLAELERLHRSDVLRRLPDAAELYRRTSATVRVACRGDVQGRDTVQVGHDDGLALRVRSATGQFAFAAVSGANESNLLRLVEDSRRNSHLLQPSETDPWDRTAGFRVDRDQDVQLPSPAEAEEWLTEATGTIGPCVEAWVEIATTVESWVAGEGLRASRVRRRAWAYARPQRTGGESGAASPLIVASRRWEGLPRDGWARLVADRVLPEDSRSVRLPGSCAVLFGPESAAVLVGALVRVLHQDPAMVGASVGPGWCLAEDPGGPDSLFGGLFDDSRFPTRRIELADGCRITGTVSGPGSYRRASYRDEPAPMAANLVFGAGPQALPRLGLLVTHVEVHPLAPDRWILGFGGAVLERGAPGPRIQRGWIAVAPADLVQRCVGTYGSPEVFRQGIRTPALLFDDLAPQSQGM